MTDEDVKADLLEKLKELDRREGDDDEANGSLRNKFKYYWTKFKIKQALGHLGLLAFLCIYCIVGGLVSDELKAASIESSNGPLKRTVKSICWR